MVNETGGGWRAVLRVPAPLLWFLGGSSLSDLGNGFFRLALPWLVYDLTHSTAAMGVLAAVQYLPILLNPWAGELCDRYGPRSTLIWSSVVQMVLVLLVPLGTLTGTLSLPLLYAVTLALALGSVLTQSATSVLVKRATPVSARLGINSLAAMLFNLSWYVSPGLAGFVIARAGVNAALLVDGASFLCILVPVLFTPRQPKGLRAPRGDLRAAIRTFLAAKGLPAITAVFGIWNFTWGGVYALEVYFFRSSLHLGAAAVGLIGTLGGILPVVLGFLGPWLVRRAALDRLMALTLATSGIGMAALGATRGWVGATAAVNVMDGAIAPVLIAHATLAQETIPDAVYGQVYSISWVAAGGVLPLGALLAGLLGARIGTHWTMALFGAFTLLGAVLSLGWLRGVRVGRASDDRA